MPTRFPAALTIGFLLFLTGGELHARANKSMIGEKFPDLNVNFIGAEPDLRGKPLIVEFWATWCPPCRDSIPHLNKVYQKYRERGLEIVGISNETLDKVEAFTRSVPFSYHVALDPGGNLSNQLRITRIPHAVLISRDGVAVWEGHPMQLKDSDIETVLKSASRPAPTSSPGAGVSDVNARDANQWTPLMHAASKGNTGAIRDLVGRGANVNVQDDKGWTPLMLAAHKGHGDAIRALLIKGANPNLKTGKRTTALMVAAGKGHVEAVEMLLDAGADRQARDAEGQTALDYARQKGSAETVKLLEKTAVVTSPAKPVAKPSAQPAATAAPARPTAAAPKPSETAHRADAAPAPFKIDTGKTFRPSTANEEALARSLSALQRKQLPPLSRGVLMTCLAVAAVLYLFHCYCLKRICDKAETPSAILVWIPGLQIFPMLRAANVSYWSLLLVVIPLVNLGYIFWIHARLCQAVGKSPWLVLLLIVPGGPLILFPYLAFSS